MKLKGSWRTTFLGALVIVGAVCKFLLAQFDGDPSTNMSLGDLSLLLAAGLGNVAARDNGVTSEEAGAKLPKDLSGVLTKVSLLIGLLFIGCMAVGCTRVNGVSHRWWAGTNVSEEVVIFRSSTLLDSKNDLTKAKASQTAKTLTVGVDNVTQESTGKTVTDVVHEAGQVIPQVIKKSVVPGVP